MSIALHDIVEIESADVYKQGVLAARLRHVRDHVEFAYTPEYVESNGSPVATTLPLTHDPTRTPARSVPPYFAGLLPEGRRLTALRRAMKTSADDDFGLLIAIGEDPIGDVQVVPAGDHVPAFGTSVAPVADLATVSFSDILRRGTGETNMGEPADRGGIAGVQDKVSGRMISFPVSFAGASAILKLDPPEFPHLVANEAFFLEMARDCGLETAAAKVIEDRDGRPGLLVTRFDRFVGEDGTIRARACEDASQILGRYPGDKYVLSTEAVFDAVSGLCDASRVASVLLLRQLIFALITGNGDLHAKNISALQINAEWRISPAYDLPSSYPYGDTTLALSVRGSREAQVSRRAILEFGRGRGLPDRAATLTLDDLLRRATPWLDEVDRLPFDQRRRNDLRKLMKARIRLLSAR